MESLRLHGKRGERRLNTPQGHSARIDGRVVEALGAVVVLVGALLVGEAESHQHLR